MFAALRALWADRRGAVTAEFAVAIPAMLIVLGLAIGAVQLSAQRVALTALAGDVARLEARGDDRLAAARISEHAGSPLLSRSTAGGILCVAATSSPRAGLLAGIRVTGRGCAAITAEGAFARDGPGDTDRPVT
ncbi:TadE/TadG family type IV pilus assembly protein [Leucobacter komagatae]|nr:pilus assembly protein [Leucobacter komagatae]